jgi:hypothetical protein
MKTYSTLVISTVLFLTYSISSFAFDDLNDLLDNSDITWAAEVYTDYAPNVNHFAIKREKLKAQYGISDNTFVTLKIQQDLQNTPILIDAITLAQQMLEVSSGSKSKFFKDANLKEPLSHAEYQEIIQGKTPLNNDGKEHQFNYKISPYQISLFRVKQILYYNEKTNELSLTPVAVAPIFCIYNKAQELTGTIPLFWMPIQDLNQDIDLNSTSINWAKRITRTIDNDEVSVIKGKKTLADILNAISNRYAEAPESGKLYHCYSKMLPMSSKDVKNLNNGIDTIITFDPVTFEEIVSEIDVVISPKTMSKIRIIQDWVWNKETQSINIKFIAFAPIVKRFDKADNFLHAGPLFFKKAEEE